MANHQYSSLPSPRRVRHGFSDPWRVTTTMSVGKLYPIKCQEVVAGDMFKEDLSFVSRLTSAFVKPVMDDLYMDLYAFYVPSRILFDDYESVFGDPKPSAYSDPEYAFVPSLPASTVSSKSVADYLQLPLGSIPAGCSVLPFRAFAMIWNQYFRNENTTDETNVLTGDTNPQVEQLNNLPWSATNYMGQLPYVGKIKDYFTSAVPQPQKGAPVSIPLTGIVPVTTVGSPHNVLQGSPVTYSIINPSSNIAPGSILSHRSFVDGINGSDISSSGFSTIIANDADTSMYTIPNNLVANLTDSSAFSTVDQLRLAMQKQLMLTADTLYGSRFREFLFGHFGVRISDKTVQVPQFLSGKRVPLNVQQVAQTSASSDDSPLASLAGYSYTPSIHNGKYRHYFEEPGYVIWTGCIRYKHSYQQGIPKHFFRLGRDDFYDPLLAHIGYQPIYRSEIYAAGQSSLRANIFGYTEAWIEFKHTANAITGEARSQAANTLDVYHFGDDYSSPPIFGAQFNQETPLYVDRSLTVPSTSQDQFIVDFKCNSYKVRIMPVYCLPGYMDHWNFGG